MLVLWALLEVLPLWLQTLRSLLLYLQKNVQVLAFWWVSFANFCHVVALKTFTLSVMWLSVFLFAIAILLLMEYFLNKTYGCGLLTTRNECNTCQFLRSRLQKCLGFVCGVFFFPFALVLFWSDNQCQQSVSFTQPSHLKHSLWGLGLCDCCFFLGFGYELTILVSS